MRTLKYHFAIVLLCGCLFSCTKEEPEIEGTAEVSLQPSGICGTWEWDVNFLEGDYLRVEFREHSYRVESHFPYVHNDFCCQHSCFFYDQEQGNYKIENGKFYRWHVTPLPNFAEIPFPEDLPPSCKVTLNGDTMLLQTLWSAYQGPNEFPTKYKLVRVR